MRNFILIMFLVPFLACSQQNKEVAKTDNPEAKTDAHAGHDHAGHDHAGHSHAKPADGKVQWMSIEEAQEMTKKSPKPILVDIYTEWCGPCKMLARSFEDPAVAAYVNETFYAVKFNGESPDPVNFAGKTYSNPGYDPNKGPRRRNSAHELTRSMGLRGYPTLFVLDKSTLQVTDRLVGYKPPDALLSTLKTSKAL